MDVRKTGVNNPSSATISNAANSKGAEKADKSGKNPAANKAESKSILSSSSQVNVSDRAQMMAKAKDIARGTEVNNDAKVARLQKLIDEGNYKVDAEALADKLVDTHMAYPE